MKKALSYADIWEKYGRTKIEFPDGYWICPILTCRAGHLHTVARMFHHIQRNHSEEMSGKQIRDYICSRINSVKPKIQEACSVS